MFLLLLGCVAMHVSLNRIGSAMMRPKNEAQDTENGEGGMGKIARNNRRIGIDSGVICSSDDSDAEHDFHSRSNR